MIAIKEEASILLLALLLSALLITAVTIEVAAQQEMTSEWAIDNENPFTELAVSADGKYLVASTNTTNNLYVFHENELLWTAPVDPVSSLAMSANGEYIAVGAKRRFFLFTRGSSTPRTNFQFDGDYPLVAISAHGNITAVAATSHGQADENSARLYLFEHEEPTPIWNTTLPGVLENLSLSGGGDYVVASTSHPGLLYLFSSEEATPLWTYTLGGQSGGAKISHDGGYIVAVGSNQTGDKDVRIYQFRRHTAVPHYMKAVSALPSVLGLSIAANGSIFAMSHTNSLMFFNLDLPPYGYGPGSVLQATLPRQRVSMTMSADGRHIIVGTVEGLYTYEYADHQLHLRKQYTVNKPFILDVASSTNGQFIIAATIACENSAHSTIHFLDNFTEPHPTLATPWVQLAILVIILAVGSVATIYVLRRDRAGRESDTRCARTGSTAGNYLLEASRLQT